MILEPRENFAIVRQLPDHTDSTTYYVRAVIRNAKTDALIDTVSLTDRGNRRFSRTWQTPADPSGQGLYIAVLSTVYTDSGYTTKSPLYGEEMQTYLVTERYNPRRRSPGVETVGQGGDDVDYKKIRKIVKEEIDLIKNEPIDLSPILDAVNGVKRTVAEIKMPDMPDQESLDLNPILDQLTALSEEIGSKIEAIKIPEPEKLDLGPVFDKLDELKFDDLREKLKEMRKVYNALEILKFDVPEIAKDIDAIKSDIKDFLYTINLNTKKPEENVVPSSPDFMDRARNLVGLYEKKQS